MNHQSMQVARRAGFRSASRFSALALVALGAGCGGAPGAGDTTGPVGAQTSKLECYDYYGEPIPDANCPWVSQWQDAAPDGGADLAHTVSPALCMNPNSSWLIVGVDSTQHFRTLAMGQEQNFSSSWGVYAQSQGFKFGSRPACSARGTGTGIFIAGKVVNNSDSSKNNKLFVSAGDLPNGDPEQPAPNATGTFTVLDNTNTYTQGGNPALAFNGSQAVLVTLGVDRFGFSRIFAYTATGNTFGSRISGPRLPSGVSVSGTPAIDFQSSQGTFHIIVRSPNTLFETYFQGSAFTNSGGAGGTIAFVPVPLSGPFDSDAALAYSDSTDIETLFFRRGAGILQTSDAPSFSPVLGQAPLLPMPQVTDAFTGQPFDSFGTPSATGFAVETGGPAFVITRFGTATSTGPELGYIFTSNNNPLWL